MSTTLIRAPDRRLNDTENLMKPLRGGAWDLSAHYMRAAFRRQSVPGYCVAFLGFRVARAPLPIMISTRGGACVNSEHLVRSANRNLDEHTSRYVTLGFRVARDLLPVHMALRGGAWFLGNGMARTASRLFSYRDYRRGMCGFRVVRAAEQRPALGSIVEPRYSYLLY
jgi:formylglycine-generating enzyme required for sulfatase activity